MSATASAVNQVARDGNPVEDHPENRFSLDASTRYTPAAASLGSIAVQLDSLIRGESMNPIKPALALLLTLVSSAFSFAQTPPPANSPAPPRAPTSRAGQFDIASLDR